MTKREERVLELLQKYIFDKGLILKGEMEKAVVLMTKDALKGVSVEGKEEDIKDFRKYLPRFASQYNVRIIEN